KFERTVKAGEYEPYTTMEADGHPSISLSNRYFTKAHLAQHAIPIAFPANVDPKGHLKRAGGSAYVHLADNVVEYHGKERTVVNNELVDDFQPIGPAGFRIGQIVEAQVTFAMIPTSATKRKLLVTLRSLAILANERKLVSTRTV
ncbi:hypothetical protein BD410DRAFT_735625, partial [Rickenella mellea]